MTTKTKTYELPLSREYVRHWGLLEAIRELIQNAIDSDSPFEYAFEGDTITITSRFTTLDPRTLILGSTSKAGQADKIGSFGEGYKIALLVLARLGKCVFVQNGDKMWRPSFVDSEQFGGEVFCIHEEDLLPALTTGTGLEFMVADLSTEEQEAIRSTCLMMQRPMMDVIGTSRGSILPSRPGKLYIGGLFVCDTKLTYGYDVLPQHLALERDRKTVDGFDLNWLIKDMWADSKRWDHMAQMMLDEVSDVEYLHNSAPAELKAACLRLYDLKHPGAIAAKDQADLDRIKAVGSARTAVVPRGFHMAVTTSAGYQGRYIQTVVETPQQILQAWYEQNKGKLGRMPKVAFKQLLVKAKGWIDNAPF